MNPYHVIGKARHCPKCLVDIASLNCPRCGTLTEMGAHLKPKRVRSHEHLYTPEYVLCGEALGREDRKKVPIPRAES